MLEARSRTKSDAQSLYVRQQSQYNTGCTEKHVSSFRKAAAEWCSSSSSTAVAAVGGSARGGEVLGGELGASAST